MAVGMVLSIFSLFHSKQVAKTDTTAKDDKKMSKLERIDQAFELEYLKTVDPATNTVPRERLLKAKAYTEQLLREKAAIAGVDWEERGPNNVGGRTRAIIFDASDATNNTVWAAGVGGGLWKSVDFKSEVRKCEK